MADEAVFSRYLPEDLISNILLRLPVRSLLVCTSISKRWNSFIKSPAFFSSHLNRTISDRKENDSDLCLLQICSVPTNTGTDRFFLRYKDQELSESVSLHFPFAQDRFGYQVVASCYGLVYLMHGKYSNSFSLEWMLWNPATRKTLVITEHQNAMALEAVGLGFDSKTGDFKLVSIVEEPWRDENLRVNLYSLKANSWKRLPDLDYTHKNRGLRREMAFVNGVLHFVGLRSLGREPRFVILGFDLADEVFHEIMLPECMANCYADYLVATCGETLSVLCSNDLCISNIEIWLMKEYGVERSWTKVSTVRLDDSVHRVIYSISGLVFKDDSHVLFSLSSNYYKDTVGRIFSHDLKSQETEEIETGGGKAFFYLGNYVESLVLLDGANERPAEIEQGVTFMGGYLESLGLDEANDPPSVIEPAVSFMRSFLRRLGVPVEANDYSSKTESDDGNDARLSSYSKAEETAGLEEDSDDSDSSFHSCK